jgi:pyruvate dehydrogenase E2 component (dihydrolipoamide acetyltransferase)
MISEVVMPQMGADMTEGTLLRWLKAEGDEVTRGEIIAEIETDKANVEIEAFESGVFRKTLASEGDVVQVGEVIALIGDASDDISTYANGASSTPAEARAPREAALEERKAAASTQPAPEKQDAPSTSAAPAPTGRVRASPLARRIAKERGIDLAGVRGTGPDGRITKKDVEAASGTNGAGAPPAQPAAAASAQTPEMSRMRQAIARNMSQSKREAPHYYLLVDIDMTSAGELRKQINGAVPEDERVSFNDLLVRAAALALQEHPEFNATLSGDQITRHPKQNVCIAIALDDGLIAPAIVDAGRKPLRQIGAEAKDLAERAKNGRLRAEELTSGTFTITNLGAYGVETLIGIIQPPQTAILGVGSIMQQAAVRDGEVAVRDVMKVALSADHRATDGAQGAQFLAAIKRLLEQPVLLLL